MVELLDLGGWGEQLGGGLELGLRYAVLALGLWLILSTLGIVNFAHGAIYMLGAYTATLVSQQIGFFPGLVVSPLLVSLLGLAIERLLLRRLYKGIPHLGLLFTFGLALFVEQAIRLFFVSTPDPVRPPSDLPSLLAVGSSANPEYRGFSLLASIIVILGLWLFLQKTSTGRVLRASSRDPAMVRLLGISVAPALTLAFGLGFALAAFAGLLASPLAPLDPAMGNAAGAFAFVAVMIAGLGSFWVVVLSGLVIGQVIALANAVWAPMAEVSVYLLLLLVLLRPPAGTVRRALAAVRAGGR